MKMRSLVGLSAHSTFHWWSAQRAARMLLLLSDKLMSCCAAGTNGCLDLRRRAFALGGQVSAEWSRCPSSMARRASDNVAPLRRNSAGRMRARIGRLSTVVGLRHPVTIRKASLMVGSISRAWALYQGQGHCWNPALVQCSVTVGWLFAKLLLQHPNRSQHVASWVRRVMSASCEVTQGVGVTWATCPTSLRGT